MLDMAKQGAKQGVKGAALFFLEHVKFALPGVLLSLGLALWAFRSLSGPGMTAAGHAGGAGALMAVLVNPKLLGFLILLIGFPIAHLIYARKRGVARVVQLITEGKKDAMASYVVERFTGFVEKTKPGMLGNAVQSQQDWLDTFDKFLASKEGMPKVLRKVIAHFSHKTGIAQAIGVAANEAGGKITTQQLSDIVAQKISGKIDEFSAPPPVTWFFVIVAANIGLCLLIRAL
jgi:hypothetical protein